MATSTYSLATALVLAALALGLLHHRGRRRRDVTGVATVQAGDLVRTASLAMVLAIVQAAVGVALLDFDRWDLMSVVYLDAVVALPLVALVLLVGAVLNGTRPAWPTLTRPARLLAALALVPAMVGWYATRVEPFALEVDEEALAVDPDRAGDGDLTIGVLSDLQTVAIGSYEREAVDRLLDTEPDIVLVTGDLFQGTASQFEEHRAALRSLLERLDVPGGTYLVPGDTDEPDDLAELVAGTPVRLLRDEVASFEVGDRRVKVAGMTLGPTGAGRDVLERMQRVPGDEIRIVAAHRPDWVLRLAPDSRVDLVVAGHTHGGQVQLPGIGPLLTLSRVPREVAAGGLHEVDGNAVYVSTGVGREQQGAPQVRFLAPPSVGVLTLHG